VQECCDHGDCTGECEFCNQDGACERACAEGLICCGPVEDVTCVEECCNDEDCDDCFVCNANGVCEPDAIECPSELQACCSLGELVCLECCGHEDCDICEICVHGACVPDPACCPRFGEPCGLIVNGTTFAEGDPDDCCPGLVCCEVGKERICAECCVDRDCPNGKCCCQDGTCSHRCCDEKGCDHDKDCPKDTCCCHDGTCSHACCEKRDCKSDHDCPKGTCCCHDGSCSSKCCTPPATTPPPVGGPPIAKLPDTGAGDGSDGGIGAIGAAALGAAAAYLAGKTRREPASLPEETSG
jgi:hypothetical protein